MYEKLFLHLDTLNIRMYACKHLSQAPIRSMEDVSPYLEQYLGQPTSIDTSYLITGKNGMLCFYYKDRPDLSYQRIAEVLSKGFNIPLYSLDTLTLPAIIKMLPVQRRSDGYIIHKIEFGKASKNSASYLICIRDENNELPPSSE